MDGDFRLMGHVPGAVRSDAGMALIDKDRADMAFRACKKELDRHLSGKGFVKYRTNAYIRKNKVDVCEYIDLQKDAHGSCTFTVNYALIPLYIPHDCLSFTLGGRLGSLICGSDIWWDSADEDIAAISFKNVSDAIDIYLLPWFEKLCDNAEIKSALLCRKTDNEARGGHLSRMQQQWLDCIDDHTGRDDIIRENISTLKLPAGLIPE